MMAQDANPASNASSAIDSPLDARSASLWAGASNLKLFVFAALFAAFVFLVSSSLDFLLLKEHDSPRFTVELSDIFAAIVVGAVFYLYGSARRREVLRRLETISLMNHHIRNALQVIASSSYLADRQKEVDAISESVNRIQWALREILPKL